jgi:hypothetical protein
VDLEISGLVIGLFIDGPLLAQLGFVRFHGFDMPVIFGARHFAATVKLIQGSAAVEAGDCFDVWLHDSFPRTSGFM